MAPIDPERPDSIRIDFSAISNTSGSQTKWNWNYAVVKRKTCDSSCEREQLEDNQ